MKPGRQTKTLTAFRKILFFTGAALLVMTTCASCQTASSKSTSRPQSKAAEARSAQQYYDQGLQEYSRENYQEAKTLFQRVIDLDPNAELKAKAQDNLKKTMQVLKTLAQIKAK